MASQKASPRGEAVRRGTELDKRDEVNSRLTAAEGVAKRSEVMLALDEAAFMKSSKSPHPTCAKVLDSFDEVGSAQATSPLKGKAFGTATFLRMIFISYLLSSNSYLNDLKFPSTTATGQLSFFKKHSAQGNHLLQFCDKMITKSRRTCDHCRGGYYPPERIGLLVVYE